MMKWIISAILVVLIGLGIYVFFNYYWSFGTGVKSGTLNFVTLKGYVFKTYEGRVIQAGLKGSAGGGIQMPEFDFSIEDSRIGDSLMRCTGREVELHYIEYKNTLPWRGMQKYIVDSILAVR